MNSRLVSLCLLALGALSATSAAHAADCTIKASGAWIRLPPTPAMPMAAGFVRIDNPCAQAVSIVGAESLSFGDVSLHESRMVDGVNQMRELDSLPIAAKQSVQLKPGGLHLMLMQPESPLQEGEQPVITLKLKDGRSLPVTFTVRKTAP